ncbi:D-2-hydroxyacid dehydrogenase [Corticicoccus populi]|uniref:D-2-hydroxyacid dehydrogenase n=1 Tax=Corticicoccus populi TaxID=1812821 RepID=A0ABW5X029_9STAP
MMERILAVHMDLEEEYVKEIEEAAEGWSVHTGKDLSEDILKEAEILFHWKKDKEALYFKNDCLKWVQTFSAGVDSLDLKQISEKKITLTSASGVHRYPISETIFAFMLGFTREFHTYQKAQQKKEWSRTRPGGEIHEKTIAILGVGEIGRETAKIAKAFNMTVLGVRNSGKAVDNVDEMYTPDQLTEILRRSDFVISALPLTKETHHLIGKAQFAEMKDSAFIVNIGRGPVVDEAALIEALKNKQIAGAGLDVFESEPLSEESALWDMDNVIITPHTAGSTDHYNGRVVRDIFIPNLKEYLRGAQPSINRYNHERGY